MDTGVHPDLLPQLRDVFDFCDADKSGYLSVQEIQESAGKFFNEQQIEQLIEILDPNGQGEISFTEFCQGIETVFKSKDGELETFDECDQQLTSLSGGVSDPESVMYGHDIVTYCVEDPIGDEIFLSTNNDPSCSKDNSSDLINFNDEVDYESSGEKNMDEELKKEDLYLHPEMSIISLDSVHNDSNASSPGSNRGALLQQRNSWLRSSLRRSAGSNKRLSSNALAHKLFRSSSPMNGHSVGYDSDDMSSDPVSLEEDVQTLNEKIHQLQEQVAKLTDSQSCNDNRYEKVKQENASLMTRIHLLEEQIREHEIRSEERLKEEQQRLKEIMNRHERDKTQELEDYLNRIHVLQIENQNVTKEVSCLRNQVEKLKQDKLQLQEKLDASVAELNALKVEKKNLEDYAFQEKEKFIEKQKTDHQLLAQHEKELKELRSFRDDMECVQRFRSPSMQELPARYLDLDKELKKLREENKNLKETNEELQAQLLNFSLEKGCDLSNKRNIPTLEDELESLSKEQLMKALRDQEEDNIKLRSYIDAILLNIVENYPQLLEVKPIL